MLAPSYAPHQLIPGENYPIQPHHIDTNGSFFGFFESEALANTARELVIHYQSVGQWQKMTGKEVMVIVSRREHADHLLSRYFVWRTGWYIPTHAFIMLCFTHSPAFGALEK